jgi:hypothetical protein
VRESFEGFSVETMQRVGGGKREQTKGTNKC